MKFKKNDAVTMIAAINGIWSYKRGRGQTFGGV